MAIIDVFQRVSENQALTGPGIAGNFVSSSIDLSPEGVAGKFRDVGRGNELALRIQVTEAFSGAATQLDTTLVVSDDSDAGFFITNLINLSKWSNLNQALTLNAVFTLPLATIPQHMLQAPLGPNGQAGRRYLGVLYTVIGGEYATGKVTADFGHWRDTAQPALHKIGYSGP